MNATNFNEVFYRRFRLSEEVLAGKAAEYASDTDRLKNFKVAAALQEITPEQALMGMWSKHVVSVVDLIKKGKRPPQAMIDEKIGDTINYLVLLEALWKEQRDENS